MISRDYFKGKRIAVIGLGVHGEMVEDVKYLIKAGAWVSIYDLKSEARLKHHLVFLRSVGLANYVCGSIPPEDLLDMDLIILSHEYPRDSSFLKGVYTQNEERKREKTDAPSGDLSVNLQSDKAGERTIADAEQDSGKIIQIEYQETLFFKLAPPVTLVGVLGACGKSTVISILEPLLEQVCKAHGSQGFFVIDPESADGVLNHLKKVKNGDIVLMRIVTDMVPEMHSIRISPHVAIYTTMPTVKSYINSPFEILAYQTYNNFIIASDEVIDATRNAGQTLPRAKMLRTKASLIPDDWGFEGSGSHDKMNAALAVQAAQLFKVDDDMARHVLQSWKALKGRLEFVKKVKNVEFYNDAMSVTPDATLAGIAALAQSRNVVLIFGGMDGGYEYKILFGQLARYVHTVISIPGSGTMRQRVPLSEIEGVEIKSASSIDGAVQMALESAQKGDKVLFSPGFDAGGVEGSKVERGERFVRAVRGV